MVTTLNITLDDGVAEEVSEVKDQLGLTWPEYIEASGTWAPVNSSPEPVPEPEPTEPSRDPQQETLDVSVPIPDEVRDAVPGAGPKFEARLEVLEEMAALLKRRGSAEKDDFLELVDPDEVRYSSKNSFWSNCVKGKETLREVPGIQAPPEGNTVWRWSG